MKKICYVSYSFSFGDTYMYKLKQFNFKKQQTIFIPVKYNHTCTKEIHRMPFQTIFFSKFFDKNEKIYNHDLNYHGSIVQPLVLGILRCSF